MLQVCGEREEQAHAEVEIGRAQHLLALQRYRDGGKRQGKALPHFQDDFQRGPHGQQSAAVAGVQRNVQNPTT